MASDNVPSRFNYCMDKSIRFSKRRIIDRYIKYMLIRTQQIFEYKNLPETIPHKELELQLQTKGYSIITEVDGKLYAFVGGLGGKMNEYYLPTIATVANPYLNFTKQLEIGKECIVMLNDSLYSGLMDMFYQYAYLIAECDISLKYGVINSRLRQLLIANNDKAKTECDKYMKDIEEGEKLASIMGTQLFDSIKTAEYKINGSEDLKAIIELKQFLLSHWYIELGLNSNFNMKREAINSSETSVNEDTLLPLIDNLLLSRREGIEKINQMYGTKIEVDFTSAWKKIHDEYCVEKDGEEDETVGNMG